MEVDTLFQNFHISLRTHVPLYIGHKARGIFLEPLVVVQQLVALFKCCSKISRGLVQRFDCSAALIIMIVPGSPRTLTVGMSDHSIKLLKVLGEGFDFSTKPEVKNVWKDRQLLISAPLAWLR